MNITEIDALFAFAVETAENAGKLLLSEFRARDPKQRTFDKEAKSIGDTLADEIIKKAIEKTYPEHAYLTEETGWVRRGESDFLWVIDPLDGTSNFENHNPFFAVSIGLWYKGEPLLGIIEAPALGERFSAIAGQGAFRTDLWRKEKVAVSVSDTSEGSQSYWVFCQGGEKRKTRGQEVFDQAFPQTKEFRKFGSAALELAWVGSGRADGYVTTSISFWDIAAGMIFVREAGGNIFHFDGSEYDWHDFLASETYDMQASNGVTHLTLSV